MSRLPDPQPREPRPANPDWEPFLQAILQSPDDDAPALVHADWLEENGQPQRAELVRVQIALAALPPGHLSLPLLAREQALLEIRAHAWREREFPEFPFRHNHRAEHARPGRFERGYVRSIAIDHSTPPFTPRFLRRNAPVHLLRLDARLSEDDLDTPFLEWIAAFRDEVPEPALEARAPLGAPVYRSEILERWTRLALPKQNLGDLEIRVLAAQGSLDRLRALDLEHNLEFASRGAALLADLHQLASLRELRLPWTSLENRGAAALLASTTLASLRSLDLSCNRLTLATAITPAIVARADRRDALASLRELRLAENEIARPGLLRLQRLPLAHGLQLLDLSRNPVGDPGARLLAQSPLLQNLRVLILDGCNLTSDGVAAIAQSPLARELRQLDLNNNPVGPDGARAIAQSPHLRNLVTLRLGNTRVADDGARAIAQSPSLSKLVNLNLAASGVETPGAAAFFQHPDALPALESLNVRGNSFGNAVYHALRERRGPFVFASCENDDEPEPDEHPGYRLF